MMDFLDWLLFCRLALGLTFAVSFGGKAGRVHPFAATIAGFRVLPERGAYAAAVLFLSGEAAVVGLMLVGGRWLPVGFGLALLLLAIFTLALISVLARKIQTSCHCFGTHEKPLTYYDVGRNAGLMGIAVVGLWMAGAPGGIPASLTLIEWLFMLIIAVVFVLLWTNLAELVSLFRAT